MASNKIQQIPLGTAYREHGEPRDCYSTAKAVNLAMLTIQFIWSSYVSTSIGVVGVILVVLPNMSIGVWSWIYHLFEFARKSQIYRLWLYFVSWSVLLFTLYAMFVIFISDTTHPYGFFLFEYLILVGWNSSIISATTIL